MKFLCFLVLVFCVAVSADDVKIQNELFQGKKIEASLGPFSLSFASERHADVQDDLTLLENALSRSLIAETIQAALESFRDVVINGSDTVPVLDPLEVDTIGPAQFTITGLRAEGRINNLRVEGLRWYIVDYVNFNALRLSFGAHVTLPWLITTGTYDVQTRVALVITHRAGGNFRVFINRLEVGVDVRLGTNIWNGHLLLRELNIKLDIHDTHIHIDGITGSSVINSAISAAVQNLTQDIVQTHLDTVSQMISDELFDVINDFLRDFTINDILG